LPSQQLGWKKGQLLDVSSMKWMKRATFTLGKFPFATIWDWEQMLGCKVANQMDEKMMFKAS